MAVLIMFLPTAGTTKYHNPVQTTASVLLSTTGRSLVMHFAENRFPCDLLIAFALLQVRHGVQRAVVSNDCICEVRVCKQDRMKKIDSKFKLVVAIKATQTITFAKTDRQEDSGHALEFAARAGMAHVLENTFLLVHMRVTHSAAYCP